MSNALYIGATGMQAQQMNVDTIANNLANANTAGYKKSRIGFTEMMVQDLSRISALNPLISLSGSDAESNAIAALTRTGAGVRVSSSGKVFDTGEFKKTDSALDIAIQGEGFLEVMLPDGTSAYSRGGTLKVTKDNQLALASGQVLKPAIIVPHNLQSMTISSDGVVRFRITGQNADIEAGKLELVNFTSPGQLNAMGDNLYKVTDGSGEALSSFNSEMGVGTISQGYLEGSNVKMVEEMVNLMIAQRTYEANVKLVQAADEMQGMINNLRK